MHGARIKTWQDSHGLVQNITFQNFKMRQVSGKDSVRAAGREPWKAPQREHKKAQYRFGVMPFLAGPLTKGANCATICPWSGGTDGQRRDRRAERVQLTRRRPNPPSPGEVDYGVLVDQTYCPLTQRPEGCSGLGSQSILIKDRVRPPTVSPAMLWEYSCIVLGWCVVYCY